MNVLLVQENGKRKIQKDIKLVRITIQKNVEKKQENTIEKSIQTQKGEFYNEEITEMRSDDALNI
jgi:hypothetical protein